MEATFFPNLIAFLWLGIMLMLGVFLRAKVRFFQRILFPASIIGGLIGFVLVNAGWLGAPSTQGWKVLDHTPFGVLTFHLFAFSFVGIGFLETARASDSSKVVLRGALWIALLFTMMFCLQALLGKGIFSGWAALFGGDFETATYSVRASRRDRGRRCLTPAYGKKPTMSPTPSIRGWPSRPWASWWPGSWGCRWPFTASGTAG